MAAKSGSADEPEFEEVTETRIVGITAKGVIRKRSFKRKVRKEDKSKSLGYGHNTEEYESIRKRVLQTKMATDNVAGLQHRFRMIQMMHADCLDLVNDWKQTREKRIRRQKGHDLQTTILAVGTFACLVWFVWRWIFLW